MKWKLKQDAVTAIINELDQSEPRIPRMNQAIHRKQKHLIRIAFKNMKIRTAADRIIDRKEMPLAELQKYLMMNLCLWSKRI